MATNDYTVTVDDAYVTPEGSLTKEQYVAFVMNHAAESYKNSYQTADFDSGIQAACDVYNAALPEDTAE
mgnify:CR=1 FL=1